MKNIYILSGEEIVLKEDKIKEIRRNKEDWNYRKIILENTRKEEIESVLRDAFMYLTTIDMFNMNNKILNIVVDNAKASVEILNELIDCVDENILILDVRNSDIRSLTSNSIYKKNTSKIEIQKYNKLEEKNKASTLKEIKSYFSKYNIKFESKEVEDICASYMYDNSDYSYTNIRQQLEQLSFFSEEILTKEDIYEFIGDSFNGNFFVLINRIFSCKTKSELMELMESILMIFSEREYISFLNIFIYTLKDYLRYSQGYRCKSPSNYYQFKNSRLKINDIDKLILDISNLSFKLRVSSKDVKEELLNIMWKYF